MQLPFLYIQLAPKRVFIKKSNDDLACDAGAAGALEGAVAVALLERRGIDSRERFQIAIDDVAARSGARWRSAPQYWLGRGGKSKAGLAGAPGARPVIR